MRIHSGGPRYGGVAVTCTRETPRALGSTTWNGVLVSGAKGPNGSSARATAWPRGSSACTCSTPACGRSQLLRTTPSTWRSPLGSGREVACTISNSRPGTRLPGAERQLAATAAPLGGGLGRGVAAAGGRVGDRATVGVGGGRVGEGTGVGLAGGATGAELSRSSSTQASFSHTTRQRSRYSVAVAAPFVWTNTSASTALGWRGSVPPRTACSCQPRLSARVRANSA